MKQHITPKQLNELSEKGKGRLRKWWKPLGNDYIYMPVFEMGIKQKEWYVGQNCDNWAKDWYKKKMQRFEWVRDVLPLLSFGQMIEIVQENKNNPLLLSGLVELFRKGILTVDDLWEATKEILKKEVKND